MTAQQMLVYCAGQLHRAMDIRKVFWCMDLHPYFGNYNRKQWDDRVVYRLNHHLPQFKV